jgi:hypothetical protein
MYPTTEEAMNYNQIAKILFAQMPGMDESDDAWARWKSIVKAFAEAFEKSNVKFDRYRFFNACGMEE